MKSNYEFCPAGKCKNGEEWRAMSVSSDDEGSAKRVGVIADVRYSRRNSVKVICGPNDDTFEGIDGSSVATVRLSLTDAFNIPDQAWAFANGQRVGCDYQVRPGDRLEFVFPTGMKGGRVVPPFKFYGSKWRIMPLILPLFPVHELYVSVFGGSGSDLFLKEPATSEVYNDLHAGITNLFVVLQDEDQRRELFERLNVTPYSRPQFETCLEALHEEGVEPVTKAWAFVTAANQIRNGLDPAIALPSWWSSSVDQRRIKWLLLPEHLQRIADRLRSVVVENHPFEKILRPKGKGGYDSPETFFFMDPPYLPEAREAASRSRYLFEMTPEDHEALLQKIQSLTGKVLIFGYASPLYERYLAKWRRREFNVKCNTSHKGTRPERVEVVWMNY